MTPTPPDLAQALGHETADKRIDLLKKIGEVGSISKAARAAGVSYKAAWQAIDTLSNLAGTALIDRAVGGSGGGGASLTEAGHHLLWAAEQLQASRIKTIAHIAAADAGTSNTARLSALGLRTSMRNQWPCVVAQLKAHGPLIRVSLNLSNDVQVVSRITKESAELLGLQKGQAVMALCKATAIQVMDVSQARAKEGQNLLHGDITRISKAKGGGEAAICIAPGLHLVGFAAADHGLRVKLQAAATLDESAVAIALS